MPGLCLLGIDDAPYIGHKTMPPKEFVALHMCHPSWMWFKRTFPWWTFPGERVGYGRVFDIRGPG